MFNPNEDGVTHINCYSKGKTELGRLLSNFADSGFTTPTDGYFRSVESYWYWLSAEPTPEREQLRMLYGFQAKQLGRTLKAADYPIGSVFTDKIKLACQLKINNNLRLKNLLRASTLPLVHYYDYGGKVVYDGKSDWVWRHYEELRNLINGVYK